jgi:crotonobetainyl-CoA:carnitine CoA-transferase CaiB-like acyl-CoA transferase
VKPASGIRTVERARFTAKGWRAGGGTSGRRAWEGLKIIEFGSGAAGPIATRYFVENGATVLRVESKTRPDFLRAYSISPDNPHGLEGSVMYDGLNVGKKNVALNLKKPEAVALVKRLVTEWCDAVAENYAPKAM